MAVIIIVGGVIFGICSNGWLPSIGFIIYTIAIFRSLLLYVPASSHALVTQKTNEPSPSSHELQLLLVTNNLCGVQSIVWGLVLTFI